MIYTRQDDDFDYHEDMHYDYNHNRMMIMITMASNSLGRGVPSISITIMDSQ